MAYAVLSFLASSPAWAVDFQVRLSSDLLEQVVSHVPAQIDLPVIAPLPLREWLDIPPRLAPDNVPFRPRTPKEFMQKGKMGGQALALNAVLLKAGTVCEKATGTGVCAQVSLLKKADAVLADLKSEKIDIAVFTKKEWDELTKASAASPGDAPAMPDLGFRKFHPRLPEIKIGDTELPRDLGEAVMVWNKVSVHEKMAASSRASAERVTDLLATVQTRVSPWVVRGLAHALFDKTGKLAEAHFFTPEAPPAAPPASGPSPEPVHEPIANIDGKKRATIP